MIINSLKLTNFRNHTNYKISFDEEVTLILGENGWGKTSILEAIYIITRGKSFRATDPDIIKHNTEYYRIELEYTNGEKNIATYDNNHKIFIISDKKTKRLPKNHKYPIILFQPSDLNLISNSPSRRRDYFDHFFSQLSESYNDSLLKYNKALKQRNELLKNDFLSKDAVFSWDILLSKYGTILYSLRKKFIQEINSNFNKAYFSISHKKDNIEIIYKTDCDNIATEDSYLKQLEKKFDKDSFLGHTSFGVHRDDYIFNFNHKIADGSASRGETRSLILALKFTEAKMFSDKLGIKPIVLLDDVFSELDEKHRKCLINNFKNNQIIITSVEDINH